MCNESELGHNYILILLTVIIWDPCAMCTWKRGKNGELFAKYQNGSGLVMVRQTTGPCTDQRQKIGTEPCKVLHSMFKVGRTTILDAPPMCTTSTNVHPQWGSSILMMTEYIRTWVKCRGAIYFEWFQRRGCQLSRFGFWTASCWDCCWNPVVRQFLTNCAPPL